MIMKYLKKIIGTLLFAATVFLTACGPSGSGSGSIVDIGGSSAPRPNVSHFHFTAAFGLAEQCDPAGLIASIDRQCFDRKRRANANAYCTLHSPTIPM